MFRKIYRERGPHKPYCTDYLGAGLKVRPLELALRYRYIQLNPPGSQWALVFDLDYEAWGLVASEDCNLPDPTWIAGNPENGHAHLAYVLKAPVCTSDAGRLAPLRYLAAIEAAYRQRLRADPLYAGLITKNPARTDAWKVFYVGQPAYTLDELAAWVREELAEKPLKRPLTEIAGLGRNCHIFDRARLWAYPAVREYWGRPEEWHDAVFFECQAINAGFGEPLYYREVNGIAKSIAGWTWKKITQEGFSESQSRSSGKRWGPSKKAEGVKLLQVGLKPSQVAELLGVDRATVWRWRSAGLRRSSK